MSFQSAVDDFMAIRKKQGRRQLKYNPPLRQGQTYLKDRSRMCSGLQSNLKLIEGFQDQNGTNKHVVAGLTHGTQKDNVNFRKPVQRENTKEFAELVQMQKSLNTVSTEWTSRLDDFIIQSQGQTKALAQCIKDCKKQSDVDTISACQYGCTVGHFANSGATTRSTGNPATPGKAWAAPWWADLVMGIADVASAAVGAADVMALAQAEAAKGFVPAQGLNTTGGGSPNVGPQEGFSSSNTKFGSYGPQGYGKQQLNQSAAAQRARAGNQINALLDGGTLMAPAMHKDSYNMVTKSWSMEVPSPTAADIQAGNSQIAIRATAINNATAKLSRQIEINPIVNRMAATNIDATNLGKSMENLRSHWKNIFTKACSFGIGGGTSGAKFAGHTQHCRSWTTTREGRSGFYSQTNPQKPKWANPGPGGAPYTVDANGKILSLIEKETQLANVGQGCDLPIQDTLSGFCECQDGSFKYADKGHGGGWTCNQACAPENASKTASGLLYHNTGSWKLPTKMSYTPTAQQQTAWPYQIKRGDAASVAQAAGQALLNRCGADGDPGDIPMGDDCNSVFQEYVNRGPTALESGSCPSGLQQMGPKEVISTQPGVRLNEVYKVFSDDYWKIGPLSSDQDHGHASPNTYQLPAVNVMATNCRLPVPGGYYKPPTTGPVKLTALPTRAALVDACDGGNSPDAPYGNIQLDMLEIKVLGLVMIKKAAILYEAIKQSYSGSNAAALKRTAAGRSLLKNMAIYEKAFKYLRNVKRKNMIIDGMLEDVRLKKGSLHISYYLWFALAIAGAGLVIKKLNN